MHKRLEICSAITTLGVGQIPIKTQKGRMMSTNCVGVFWERHQHMRRSLDSLPKGRPLPNSLSQLIPVQLGWDYGPA